MSKFEDIHWIYFVSEAAPQSTSLTEALDALSEMFGVNFNRHNLKDYVNKMKKDGVELKTPSEYLKTSNIEHDLEYDLNIQNLKSKATFYKNKYNQLLNQRNLTELILESVENNIALLPKPNVKPYKYKTTKSANNNYEQATIVLSDLHIGEVVDAEEMNGLNEYNFEIFCRRLQFVSDKIISIVENKLSGYNIDTLNLFGLGDWVSGVIHKDTIESSDLTVIDQNFQGAFVLAQFLGEMAHYFKRINCTLVIGNHGRTEKTMRYKQRHINWDYVMYNTLKIMMKNYENVSFTIPKSFFDVTDVMGNKFLLLHGDGIRMWNSVPYYGVDRIVKEFTELLRSKDECFDYCVVGHFHSKAEIPRVKGEIFINGSMVGGSEFSVGNLFKSSEPVQLFFGVHPKRGVTWRFPLNLRFTDYSDTLRYAYYEYDGQE